MKELSIEEKARRYDNIIEKANKMHSENCEACQMCIEELFPELKESEDERIRKALVELVHDTTGDSLWVDYNVHKEDAIAWLEKQGEQKPNCCDGQKPAWSEEDETTFKVMLEELEKYVMFKQYSTPLSVYDLQWFKSLKDRVQPKQEWSEEDKGNLLDVKCIIDEIWHNQDVGEVIGYSVEDLKSLWHWLDNIWQRVKYPNDIWKPSDEQMADLWNMVCECRPADQQLLQDLYFGLKTLRGE